MVLSLYNLIEAAVLVINAVAILHEERFLAKCESALLLACLLTTH